MRLSTWWVKTYFNECGDDFNRRSWKLNVNPLPMFYSFYDVNDSVFISSEMYDHAYNQSNDPHGFDAETPINNGGLECQED